MSLQKFFMFEGTGANGKSVVAGILRRVVGVNNTSGVPLNRFHDKHSLVSTYGKLVNVTGELREKDTIAEDLLKQATGGDLMHFDPKHKPAFSAPFTAKIIICTNERPAFTDRSNGLWRRIIVVPFPVSIPPERQDPELEDKLANELPGILNWAIQGALSLYKFGRFEEPKASIEARTAFQKDANPVRQFLDECCRLDSEAYVETQALYTQYRAYVLEHGHAPLSDTKFSKEVTSLSGVKKDRIRMPGGRPHVYLGITSTANAHPGI
jgi:putative DNA primase/helicase